MRRVNIMLLALLWLTCSQLANGQSQVAQAKDWLINGNAYVSRVVPAQNGKELLLTNGLIERRFRISPNFATVAVRQLVTGENYLRSVRPEAAITINDRTFNVGGLTGQSIHNYLLPEWLNQMGNDEEAFQYAGHRVNDIRARFDWKMRKEWLPADVKWPAPGKELVVEFKGPAAARDLLVQVHYEIYDGIPLIAKWISVINRSGSSVTLNRFTSEILAVVEGESSVEGEAEWQLPNLHVETDYAFAAMSNRKGNRHAAHWLTDSLYTTQVNYNLLTPCLLKVYPDIGPEQSIAPNETFESYRAWELFYDSHDKERKGMSTRKMYRIIAPWILENPVLMHVRDADEASVKSAIDQCSEAGFEMVIMTFGSGFNMEAGDPVYYSKLKALADYAHSKNVALGGYSLLASRAVSEKDDVINPATGKRGGIAYFGNSPCLGSEWAIDYFRKIREMYEQTGLDVIEHDGSYPGDICGSLVHPGHKGLPDAQWNQFRKITDFYKWCRGRGIYLNVPDWYYLNGSSKCAMGYRETNWSLPRAQQEIIERQNIFDGTWTKTPSMGWMFVPLTQYHGGGDAATIEPLHAHLQHYSHRMANLFGAGVQACYRGPRLFDTDSTKAMVKGWVDFYKRHRKILDADIIHLRRADGLDWDGILHVDPAGKEKGLLMLYNPLPQTIKKTIRVPLYYTGLNGKAMVEDAGGKAVAYPVDRQYNIQLEVTIPANGSSYYILK